MSTVRVPADLDATSLARFADDLTTAAASDQPVLVLEGSAGVFCRGLRLGSITAAAAPALDDAVRAMADFRRCLSAIRFSQRPVIAVVDGQALAGGVGVAAGCDVVIATTRATFALSEVLFGLAPATIFPLLIERMSVQQARLMALCGRTYSAAEALAMGLVDAIVAPEDLDLALKRWVRLLARGESGAVAQLKRFSARSSRLELEAEIERGAALTLSALERPVVRARIAAFESGDVGWTTEQS